MRVFHLCLCALMSIFVSHAANSTIMYHADASSTFDLISTGGMGVSAEFETSPSMMAMTGTGIASIDTDTQSDPTLFSTTSPLLQDSEVSGSASALFGSSMAAALNSYLIILDNSSGLGAATAVFDFTYSWDISLTQAPVSEAAMESGSASAFFHLSGFSPSGAETLAIQEVPLGAIVPISDWLFNPTISFDFFDVIAPPAESGTVTVRAYVTVPMGSTDSFSVITDSSGTANHITEPALFSVVLISIFIMAIRRKKRW